MNFTSNRGNITSIEILSRAEACKRYGELNANDTLHAGDREENKLSGNNAPSIALISISDIGQKPAPFAEGINGIRHLLRLEFNDEEKPSVDAISKHDAERIAGFLMDCEKDSGTTSLVVHCGAGVSRSAGVAAAASLYLFGDDSWVFDNGSKCPNMTCYRSVLDELFIDLSDDEVNDRLRRNIEVWRNASDM